MGANIKSVVVDDAPGQPFEAHFADLNNDGVLEILASCYDTRKGNEAGNLWVYQQEGETWTRSALATGFTANSYLFGNSMTPGKSRLFWPSEEYKATPTEFGPSPKPWIQLKLHLELWLLMILMGMDTQKSYLLATQLARFMFTLLPLSTPEFRRI